MRTHNVGELATMAGITVRTLHHYDEIGLLAPSGRSHNGYRIYDDDAVDRLRTILTYRELGLSLDEIAQAIDHDADEALATARDRVLTQIARLERIAASLTRSLASTTRGDTVTPKEKLAVFDGFDPDEYAGEAEQRWGDHDTFDESIRRTGTYDAQDWERIRVENDDIAQHFLSLMAAGIGPDSPRAGALVERHRAHISKWYYECTPEVHAGLGRMYVVDTRFAENIDKVGEGLAAYLSSAIEAVYDTTSGERS